MSKNILLLEDEESVNRGISFTLGKEGYQVFSCFDMRQAEKVFHDNEIQLIICDITLQDGNGLDFIRSVRKRSTVHIICLTALDQEIDQVMGYEAGADDYITKPFSLSVLSLKVQAYFKKLSKENVKIIKSAGITFSLLSMKVYMGEETISLTKNEWRMLQIFMEHPKQILSKKQLLERLFDIDENYVDENTIAVNVRRLREKVERDPANPEIIKNVRGIGYVWDKDCVKE
ncbi:response regulator transcription factor [Anaeromicropila herbilytica]|uniref:Stage 0 sporulation protein A homolog n=1 Tax=Anaeromicropila herbilytica TaxID=2785025 RepID=A0A7R7EPN3_9FIRM|nr:response regulator transcription factor [Anaeromicropila herbilytica]BCN32682.1 DNA-binding response regulator [Anaeromicropila herbilytica]